MQPQTTLDFVNRVREDLLAEISPVSDTDFTRPEMPGRWSVGEVVEHIRRVEKAFLHGFAKVVAGEVSSDDRLSKRLIGNVGMFLGPLIVARPAFRVRAPKLVEPLEVPSRPELLSNLKEQRAQTLNKLQTYTKEQLTDLRVKHPFLGSINFYQLIEFLAYHEQRHIRQIQEIKKKLRIEN